MSKAPVNLDFTSFGRKKTEGYTPPTAGGFAIKTQKSFGNKKKSKIPDAWAPKASKTPTAPASNVGSAWIQNKPETRAKTAFDLGESKKTPKESPADNFIASIGSKPEAAPQEAELSEADLEEMYTIMDKDELEDYGHVVCKKKVWDFVQPDGMRNRPQVKFFRAFTKACEELDAKVVSSFLFHHMVDAEAHFRTQIRALFAAEALVEKFEPYYNFFKQNEHNLDVIDEDEMREKSVAAAKDLNKSMTKLKALLARPFGQKSDAPAFNPTKFQEGVQQDKASAMSFVKTKPKAPKAPAAGGELNLLDLGLGDAPAPAKADGFGFLGGGAPKKQEEGTAGGEVDLIGGGEPADSDLLAMGLGGPQTAPAPAGDEFDLLGGAPKPARSAHDPFGFGI